MSRCLTGTAGNRRGQGLARNDVRLAVGLSIYAPALTFSLPLAFIMYEADRSEPSPALLLQLVLQHLIERVEEADEKGEPERIVFDEIKPVETGGRMHTLTFSEGSIPKKTNHRGQFAQPNRTIPMTAEAVAVTRFSLPSSPVRSTSVRHRQAKPRTSFPLSASARARTNREKTPSLP